MNWDEYKEICDHPSVLTRWLLEQTTRVCDPRCAGVLESILESDPITKPDGHKGGTATDMFHASLDRSVIAQITEQVQRATKTDQRTTGPVERDYSHIEKTWLEYLHWCNIGDDAQSIVAKEDDLK